VRIATLAVLLVACDAPSIHVAAADTAVDTHDTAPQCPTFKRNDLSACAGDDDDRDCVPNECDDCPNIPQPPPTGRLNDPTTAGLSCIHPSFPALTKRFFFDPMTGIGAWRMLMGPNSLKANKGVIEFDGATIASMDPSPGTRDVVATTVMRFTGGIRIGGLALRFSGDEIALTTYACVVDNEGTTLTAVYTQKACTPSSCLWVPFLDSKGAAARTNAPPAAIEGTWFVLRAAIGTRDGKRVVECQAYPYSDDPVQMQSLRLATPNANTVTGVIADPVPDFPDGTIGLIAGRAVTRSTIELASLDVLTTP
jgi:hypothetical protein